MEKLSCTLVFDYLRRTNNKAGKILELLRKENKYGYYAPLVGNAGT